jgi:hypothetical protein
VTGKLSEIEFERDQKLRSLFITNNTSTDKFKKLATYPKDDSTILNEEILNHSSRNKIR